MSINKANEKYIETMEKYNFSDPNKCYNYAKDIYDKYVNTENKEICTYCLYYMAKCKRHLNESEEGEAHILKGLRVVEDTELKINMLIEYTAILLEAKNYSLAYEFLFAAYNESFNINSNNELLFRIFNAFGVMYGEAGDSKKALKSFLQCIDYVKKTDLINYTLLHLNICETYIRLDQLDLAKEHADKCKEALGDQQINVILSYYLNLITQINIKSGEYEKALVYIDKGIAITCYDKTNFYMSFLNYRALILNRTGLKHCAIEHYKNTLKIAEEKMYDQAKEDALKGLIEIYEELGDKDQLIKYLKVFYDYENTKKNLRKVELINSIESINEKYETYKKVLRLKQQNEMLHRMNNSIKSIHDLAKNILLKNELDSVFAELYNNILALTKTDLFGIALLNESKDQININSYNWDKGTVVKGVIPFNEDENIISKVISNKQYIYIDDLKEYAGKYMILNENKSDDNTSNMKSVIYIPLYDDSEVFGALSIQSLQAGVYSQEDINLMEIIASFVSVAIINVMKSKQLNNLSTRDPLTNLFNRRALRDKFDSIISERAALLFIDIDYFKEYNDFYGHLEGDNCIHEVANILKEVLDKEDFIARYGGDEFIVLLKDTSNEYLIQASNTIISKMEAIKLQHKNSEVVDYVTLSIGAANMKLTRKDSMDEILHVADKALYQAKTEGRNQVSFIFG